MPGADDSKYDKTRHFSGDSIQTLSLSAVCLSVASTHTNTVSDVEAVRASSTASLNTCPVTATFLRNEYTYTVSCMRVCILLRNIVNHAKTKIQCKEMQK